MNVKTKKESLQSRENSIKKSNEISMAELSHGLSLNQMQLLAYAIYATQQNGKTEFQKYEFQNKFGIEQYRTEDAYKDSKQISGLQVSVKDLERDYFKFTNVFMDMEYNKGHFTFEWNPKMTPHILEIKERYVVTDLEIASYFQSSFSWRLYEYLKAHYGYFRKILSKQEIYELFNVENVKTYQERINNFKQRVLDVAIKEINKYTDLYVWYKEQKTGRSITGFEIYWNRGEIIQKATPKQINRVQSMINSVEDNMFTYAQIKDDQKRLVAFEQIDRIKSYQMFTKEPVNITSDRASNIMEEIEFALGNLNRLVEEDKPKRDTSFYYNWLEEE